METEPIPEIASLDAAVAAAFNRLVTRGSMRDALLDAWPHMLTPPTAVQVTAALNDAVRQRAATGRPEDGPYPASYDEAADCVETWLADDPLLVDAVRARFAACTRIVYPQADGDGEECQRLLDPESDLRCAQHRKADDEVELNQLREQVAQQQLQLAHIVSVYCPGGRVEIPPLDQVAAPDAFAAGVREDGVMVLTSVAEEIAAIDDTLTRPE